MSTCGTTNRWQSTGRRPPSATDSHRFPFWHQCDGKDFRTGLDFDFNWALSILPYYFQSQATEIRVLKTFPFTPHAAIHRNPEFG